MKKYLLFLFLLAAVSSLTAGPRIDFSSLMLKTELNPSYIVNAELESGKQNLPVSVYIPNKVFIEAKDIENGKIVYSVIINFAKPDIGGYTAFYEEIIASFDLSTARLRYSNGIVVDNTNEVITLKRSSSSKLLLIPDWTYDRVMAFDYFTGDLVDTAFIHSDNPHLQSPKQALQRSKSRILVPDQVSDGVYEYDTNGIFVRLFAPSGGINNAILDNLRGITFRPNGNLLVCNASGTAANTIQQFDTAGVYINSFITASVNSPYCILYRQGDILVSNSSGTPKVFKYDFTGALIGAFTNTTMNFVQQMIKNSNGNIVACDFSGTGSGLKVFDSTGTLITTLAGVTGVRGVYRLESGNYLTTNSIGLYEIDDTTGTLIRQIYAASNLQYINKYDPDFSAGIGHNNTLPSNFRLYNNYPNPFNPSTTISYEIAERSLVTLTIYDNLGRVVETLQNGYQAPGFYEIVFNAKNLSSGIYFYKISANENVETRRMVLLK